MNWTNTLTLGGLLLCALLVPPQLHAQIVNTEAQRLTAQEDGWKGSLAVSSSFVKNVNYLWRLEVLPRLRYKWGNQMATLLGHVIQQEVNRTKVQASNFLHLRYTYLLYPRWMWLEGFFQVQNNPIMRLDYRLLTGAGARFPLLGNDTSKVNLNIGAFLMHEYEEVGQREEVNRHLRASFVVHFSWALSATSSLVSTTYYQPVVFRAVDHRISTEWMLRADVWKNLSVSFTYNLFYDSRPPRRVPTTFYTLTPGLMYRF